MAERMVPVPVSLIERAMNSLLEVPPSSDNADIYGELHALLSQPEPSAEPLSIEQMAPGTTFTRDDYPAEVWTVKRDICDGGIYVLSDGHRSQNAEDIDPSTIRDVTPPA